MALESLISDLTEKECWRIFYGFRWAEGARCLKCNERQHKLYQERRPFLLRYHCARCNIWWNDFTGTIFENRRLKLSQWFMAIYLCLEKKYSAAEIAKRIKVNRHTAESMHQAIRKEEQWCRLLLNKLSAQTNKNIVFLLTFKEVQDYLGISRVTIYRLIAQGALSAIKVGGQWRFRPEEIQKYLTTKLSRYGFIAVGEFYYFRQEVLDKYRKDTAKYYLQEEAYQGWVGNKQDYVDIQAIGKKRIPAGAKVFSNLHYRKVVIAEGQPALAVRHKDYLDLPREEYGHWSNYLILHKY